MGGPLSHIRVLDLTRILAGPWATQNLADLGAEVLKIERPGSGDDTRQWGPPWLRDRDGEATHESAYFLSVNRAKKSVTLDLSKSEGQDIARQLAAKCDVFVENFKAGDLERYGLGYPKIRELHPGIIYCSITGFGQTGPHAHRAGYDFIFQGMGGLMSITGERDDLPGGGPQKVGIAVTDVLAGMYASLAITAAISHRQAGGGGQYIDLALLDTIIAFNGQQLLNYWCSGRVPGRWGNAHANIVPYEVFPTADTRVILAVGNDSQFRSFCEVARRPELADDPRFRSNPERLRNRETIVTIVQDILRTRTSAEWIRALDAAGVPCGPINDLREVFDDPQVRHRGIKVHIPHAYGSVSTVANPIRLSETPITYDVPPPLLGQHTREVLSHLLGMSDAEMDRYARAGVI